MTAGSFLSLSANNGIRLPSIFEIMIEINNVKLTNPEIRMMNNHQAG